VDLVAPNIPSPSDAGEKNLEPKALQHTPGMCHFPIITRDFAVAMASPTSGAFSKFHVISPEPRDFDELPYS
jgi:hypothetical protein